MSDRRIATVLMLLDSESCDPRKHGEISVWIIDCGSTYCCECTLAYIRDSHSDAIDRKRVCTMFGHDFDGKRSEKCIEAQALYQALHKIPQLRKRMK